MSRIPSAHKLVVSTLTTDPANKFLCSGSRDCSVTLWDVATAQQVATKNIRRNVVPLNACEHSLLSLVCAHRGTQVTGARWIPGEDAIFQTSEDLRLRVWDAKTWQVTNEG